MTAIKTHRTRVKEPTPLSEPCIGETSAWPVRDENVTLRNITLEGGQSLDAVNVRYRLEGAIAPARDNVVLVIHALTGTVHATDWWRGIVGAGHAIDPTRHAVLTANLLGGCDGTTGPTVDDPDRLPPITTRDQAAVLARLLDALGVSAPLLICGGSLGGQVTLEFAASFPERTRAAVVLAAPAAQTAQGLAWNAIMRRAIALGGPTEGLALARMVGMLSYRTPEGLERRFGRATDARGEFLVNAWLDLHGKKLVQRFDAVSFGALIDAMDSHDVGRGRGGVAAALAPVADRIIGVGVPGDLLYPASCVREWTDAIHARYIDLPSLHGHDAFLLETRGVGEAINAGTATAGVGTATAGGGTATAGVGTATAGVGTATAGVGTATAGVGTATAGVGTATAGVGAATAGAMTASPRRLRVAMAGCGHVGGSVLDLLARPGATAGSMSIDRVLVRDAGRPRSALAQAIARGLAPAQACITDPTKLLDDETDVLIEAIGGTTTARTLVESALRQGIRVVTANKALLAECGPALLRLAKQHGTRLDFEGAVAGAIPVVRCVRAGAAGVDITGFSGILNGTSNFVLDRVAEGASLSEAIRHAQALGYAEADPSRDLSGEDTADKVRVLAWLIFGVDPATLPVIRRGIDEETAAWAAHVAAAGDRVKLVATCAVQQGGLVARIVPTRVTRDDPWAAVRGPDNRIVIDSVSAGAMVFHGPGAGGRATAGAVLSDVWYGESGR